ncbi:hypothetical protein KCM76_25460 [Zooshikella marina]|uniref:Uncharacterized protein n=1 Tax=Zooshikella ganghwensis TaxID=202772 RepID=A0A4P9VMK6_9GAMM|nr:hypothetical protein [Zooshikella ganghwensis]MBU2709364.1 hypothetical protein [Zooshikella ganghwensis]RDH44638.1 hypothetical protein B9G39_15015 [Zooshikella ganghwensis]
MNNNNKQPTPEELALVTLDAYLDANQPKTFIDAINQLKVLQTQLSAMSLNLQRIIQAPNTESLTVH